MVIPEDESPRVSLDNFKQRVNQTLQEHDKIMQEQAGIVVTRDSNTLWRDATSQDSAINWTLALRQRALTYLLTASKLLEIHSTSDRYIMMPALQELADLFNEINQPQHWQNEDDAQVNFVTFTDKVFKVLKPRLGTISQKEFNYANAWVSMDMEPQVIVTELNYKGKKYTIKSEPIYGLTDDIVDEFRNRHGKVWYESLSDNTKRICDHYAAKIIAGEHYQLPAALRGVIPGLKNAYETSVYSDGKLLRRFNHCATAPMGKEHMDEAENIRLTQLNYAAMRNGHSNAKLMYTSLVADSLDTVLKLRRDVGNAVNTVMGNAISKEEFIDSTIANIAHRASKMHDNTYHTNVCLNGARIFEPFRLNDFDCHSHK